MRVLKEVVPAAAVVTVVLVQVAVVPTATPGHVVVVVDAAGTVEGVLHLHDLWGVELI